MIAVLHVTLALLAVPAVFACTYLLALTLISGRLPAPSQSSRGMRFDVIVPAHDEAQVIERTVASLRRLDWPRERFRVIVIADNCTDSTAGLARRCGAHVYERHDSDRRGKGYALEHGFASSLEASWADAIVVVDADSEVSTNLLEAFAVRLERGESAVQAHYGVLNPFDSWRTRLMTIAMTAFHVVRSRSRERLSLSCGIRGNGWCVTHDLLRRVPYRAFSLAEDLEFGIELGLAGYRVAYADEAHVLGEMVSGEQAARRQRARWESGRFRLVRSKTIALLHRSITARSRVCADLAFDLLVPPLSSVLLNVLALLGLAAAVLLWRTVELPWMGIAIACGAALAVHVVRGWQLSGIGLQACIDMLRVPVFLAWKVRVMLGSRAPRAWVRTERERS